jgi:hypothetical protein
MLGSWNFRWNLLMLDIDKILGSWNDAMLTLQNVNDFDLTSNSDCSYLLLQVESNVTVTGGNKSSYLQN